MKIYQCKNTTAAGDCIIMIKTWAQFLQTFSILLKAPSFLTSTLSSTVTSAVFPKTFFATNLFRTSLVGQVGLKRW